jgi:hypothetical protein
MHSVSKCNDNFSTRGILKRLYHKRARIYDMMQGACGGLYFTASNRSRNLRKPCPSG